nr:uncharacterized protein LOC128276583 [Anopheles cruzii]
MCVPALSYPCSIGTTTTPSATGAPPTTSEGAPTTPPAPFVCPASGRYANPGSIYCKSYYLCLLDAYDNLVPVELSCPAGSIFAYEVSRCEPDTEYECSVSNGSSTTRAPETTTNPDAPFVCTKPGKYPNKDRPDCKTYKYCVNAPVGYTEYTFSCPGTTLFDEVSLICSAIYQCTRGG